MQDRRGHRRQYRGHRARLGVGGGRRVKEMRQRFQGSVENQADAEARSKEHGDPRSSGIIRAGIVGTQFDVTGGAVPDDQHEKKDRNHEAAQQPREVSGDPFLHVSADDADAPRRDGRPEDHHDGHGECDHEHGFVGREFPVRVFDAEAGDEPGVQARFRVDGSL